MLNPWNPALSPQPPLRWIRVPACHADTVGLKPSRGWVPIGLQFGADQFREDILIALGAEFEDARPWLDRCPRLHVGTSEA